MRVRDSWTLLTVACWALVRVCAAAAAAAASELPVPLYLDAGAPDAYSAALELAADHTYRFVYSFTSISGARPGGRSESGQWTFDAPRSLLILHPAGSSGTVTEVPVQLNLRVTAQVHLGPQGPLIELRSRQVTLGRLFAASRTVPTRRFLLKLQTADGHWLTVEDRGRDGQGPKRIPLRVDSLKPGRFETFRLEVVDETHCALRTANGHYLTATNGGGVGGPNDATSPIHTDQTDSNDNAALFRLDVDRNSLRTTLQIEPSSRLAPRRYVTAVEGGGIHGPDNAAIRTDATERGPFETFRCVFTFDAD